MRRIFQIRDGLVIVAWNVQHWTQPAFVAAGVFPNFINIEHDTLSSWSAILPSQQPGMLADGEQPHPPFAAIWHML
jgi:hypothetical protein